MQMHTHTLTSEYANFRFKNNNTSRSRNCSLPSHVTIKTSLLTLFSSRAFHFCMMLFADFILNSIGFCREVSLVRWADSNRAFLSFVLPASGTPQGLELSSLGVTVVENVLIFVETAEGVWVLQNLDDGDDDDNDDVFWIASEFCC